jgi:hypothetical protein
VDKPFVGGVKHGIKVGSRPRVWARRIFSVVLALLITPILGVLATLGFLALQRQFMPHLPQKSPSRLSKLKGSITSTLPPPSVFKLTSDGIVNISLQYPTDWTVKSSDQSRDLAEFSITQPDRLVQLSIARFSTALSSQFTGPDQINSELLRQMSQQFASVKMVMSPNAEPTIGNDQWMQQDATYLDPNNTLSHFTTITVFHNRQNYYNINFTVPQSLYRQAMQQYIQPMLDSFEFLS